MKIKENGYFLIIIAVIMWSTSGLLVKSVSAGPLWITLIRSLGGGIFLLPYVFKERIYPIKNVFLAGIFMALYLGALTITTKISSSAMAISMQYTAPMYIIAYSFYKEREITFKKFFVFLFIFIGVIFNTISNLSNILAVIIGIITGVCFVFYTYNFQRVKDGNSLGIVALINLVSSVFYLFMLIFEHANPPSSKGEIILILFCGVLISGVSYAFYGAGLRKISIERALIICLAEPILNPIWVYLGNGEIPKYTTIIGLLFILLGAVTDILFNTKPNTKKIKNK